MRSCEEPGKGRDTTGDKYLLRDAKIGWYILVSLLVALLVAWGRKPTESAKRVAAACEYENRRDKMCPPVAARDEYDLLQSGSAVADESASCSTAAEERYAPE